MSGGILDFIDEVRNLPRTAGAAVTEMAEKLGIDAYPEIFALVEKREGKWELVSVALDRTLLPTCEAGQFLLSARLGRV